MGCVIPRAGREESYEAQECVSNEVSSVGGERAGRNRPPQLSGATYLPVLPGVDGRCGTSTSNWAIVKILAFPHL